MRIPKLCHHKPSGRAYVRVDRKCKYLGTWGDPDTDAKYNAFIVEFIGDHEAAIPKPKSKGLTMRQLAVVYVQHAEGYYCAGEVDSIRAMAKRVNEVAGDITVDQFTPRVFKRVREAMIKAGNSRNYINQQHGRITAMLAYGVEEELIKKPGIPTAIREVKRLARGRTAAKETPRVMPVPDEDILAAVEMMPDDLAVMVQLQLLLGCRPGELWVMTPAQIDRSKATWFYRPSEHKCAWREKERIIAIGPHAQQLLAPYLLRGNDDLCFRSLTGKQWDRKCYRDAIHAACKLAGVPCWNPYQLRHNAGTEVRRLFGLEGVQSHLGHSNRATSEIYAEPTDGLGEEIARRIG